MVGENRHVGAVHKNVDMSSSDRLTWGERVSGAATSDAQVVRKIRSTIDQDLSLREQTALRKVAKAEALTPLRQDLAADRTWALAHRKSDLLNGTRGFGAAAGAATAGYLIKVFYLTDVDARGVSSIMTEFMHAVSPALILGGGGSAALFLVVTFILITLPTQVQASMRWRGLVRQAIDSIHRELPGRRPGAVADRAPGRVGREAALAKAIELRRETLAAFAEWESDLGAVLFDRRLLGVPSEPETAVFNEAFDRMLDAVPDSVEIDVSDDRAQEILEAASAAWDAWVIADRHATQVGLGTMTDSVSDAIDQAKKFLAVAANPGATEHERRTSINRVIDTLTSITHRARTSVASEVFNTVNGHLLEVGAAPLHPAIDRGDHRRAGRESS